jgi:hypothetical protein
VHRNDFFSKNCVGFITGRGGRAGWNSDALHLAQGHFATGKVFAEYGSAHVELWLEGPVQKGEVAVKPVGTWRNTADPSTKIKGRKKNQSVVEPDGLRGYWIPTMIPTQLENRRDWRMNKRN